MNPADDGLFESLSQRGLLDAIATQLNARLARQDDPAAWLRLAQIQRARGDLKAARRAFAELVRSGNDSDYVRENIRLLDGESATPEPDTGFWPSPFLLLDEALTNEDMERLRAVVRRDHDGFKPVRVMSGPTGESRHDSNKRIGEPNAPADVQALIRPFIHRLATENFQHFALAPFEVGMIECKVTLHEERGHFRPHSDASERNRRRLSFGLYFELDGREFSGGDLLLFDHNAKRRPGGIEAGERGYTRMLHRHNRLVMFPSDRLHEALPVTRTGDTPGCGRYAIIGHVREATPE